jgi:hypothetical protein
LGLLATSLLFARSDSDRRGANLNQMFTGQEREPEAVPNVDFLNALYMSGGSG